MHKLSYRRHRFPSMVIQQAVWLYFRFALSYRDIEDMLAERGIDVSSGLTAEHDRGLRANNRAENSHQPIRRRERKLQRFKSPGSVQRFLAIHATTFNAFTHQRHLLRRPHFKELRAGSFRTWAGASATA